MHNHLPEVHISITLDHLMAAISVSDSIYSLLGFDANDFLTGKVSLQSRIHTDDQDIADELFSIEPNPASRSFNIRLRHANGRIRCIKGHYNRAKRIDGWVLEILLKDAKSLWQAQTEQSMLTNFNALMDNTDDFIYFKDLNHVFIGASKSLVKTAPQLQHWQNFLGLTSYDVYSEEYADVCYRLEKEIFSGAKFAHDIQEIRLPNDGISWVDNKSFPIKNAQGEITGAFGVAHDITESKLNELTLIESEAALQESQKIAGLGSYVYHIQDKIWASSDTLDKILGIDSNYPRTETSWDALIHPDDLASAKHYLRRKFAKKSLEFDREYRVIRPSDGAERYIRGLGRLVFDEQGNPLRMHGTIQDMTVIRNELLNEKRAILGNQLVGALALKQRRVIWANSAFETMLGYEPGELVGVSTRRFYINEQEFQSVEATYAEISKHGIGHTQHQYVRKDGSLIWVALSGTLLNKENDESLWTFVDISQQKNAENELRIAAVAFESHESMLITDANNVILRVNRAFSEMTGYEASEVIGQTPKLLKSDVHDQSYYADMWNTLLAEGKWQGELWNKRKNGELYPEFLTITAVKNLDGKVTNFVGSATDITHSKAAAAEIENLAFYDHLTALPNRRLLLDRLKQALLYSARHNNDGAILFLDLDHFKTINDTLGHDTGDTLLQEVANRLTACVREGDTVARLGGDEFVVMIEGLSELKAEAATHTEDIGEKIWVSVFHD